MVRKRLVLTLVGVPVAVVVGLVTAAAISPMPGEGMGYAANRGNPAWQFLNKPAFAAVTIAVFAAWTATVSLVLRRRTPPAGAPS